MSVSRSRNWGLITSHLFSVHNFLPLPEEQGEMDTDANPLRGYTKKDLCLTNHEITDGLGIDDLGLTYCGILDAPGGG